MSGIITNDIEFVKRSWMKGYKNDPGHYYPDKTGKCPVCQKKWIVVKGRLKKPCDCKDIRKA